MMTDVSNIVFEDLFTVTEKDRDGKKFDKVSRMFAKSDNYEMDMILDVNIELYPFNPKDRFTVVLARSLALDGVVFENEGVYDPLRSASKTLADDYEYVMFGKVYKFDENKAKSKVQVFISYGGLLMCLEGDARHLQELDVGKDFYLLIRLREIDELERHLSDVASPSFVDEEDDDADIDHPDTFQYDLQGNLIKAPSPSSNQQQQQRNTLPSHSLQQQPLEHFYQIPTEQQQQQFVLPNAAADGSQQYPMMYYPASPQDYQQMAAMQSMMLPVEYNWSMRRDACRRYPECAYGDDCRFFHPNSTWRGTNRLKNYGKNICRNYPNCSYGEKCKFAHPTAQ